MALTSPATDFGHTDSSTSATSPVPDPLLALLYGIEPVTLFHVARVACSVLVDAGIKSLADAALLALLSPSMCKAYFAELSHRSIGVQHVELLLLRLLACLEEAVQSGYNRVLAASDVTRLLPSLALSCSARFSLSGGSEWLGLDRTTVFVQKQLKTGK